MTPFDEIWSLAAARKGGDAALEALLSKPAPRAAVAAIPNDRWLAEFTRSIFQAGFNWKVVDAMWPGFEAAFEGFDIHRCAMLHDEDFDRLTRDTSIVRHAAKIMSVQANAAFLLTLAETHGAVGRAIADWPASDFSGLTQMLKTQGSRLGGMTGPYALRHLGVDSYLLTRDVVARLIACGVVDKAPTSARDQMRVQNAFNIWMEQSGRSLTEISRVLAFSV